MVLDHWSNDAMVSMDRYGLSEAEDEVQEENWEQHVCLVEQAMMH